MSSHDTIQQDTMMIWNQVIAKPYWTVALILSILYVCLFILVSKNVIPNTLLFGFCVWGNPQTPTKEMGCIESPLNSHWYSFIIDVIMTFLVGVFWCLDTGSWKNSLFYMSCASLILCHGILHWFLQQTDANHHDWLPMIVNCYVPKDKMMGALIHFGYILFGSFSLLLCMVILGFGFGWNKYSMYASLVCTGMILMVTKDSGGELVLPGLFCIIHPLTCFTGLFSKSKSPVFHEKVGGMFILCTIVGILELTACDVVLRPLGGHCWYDFTLHLAVLFSLPFFWPNKTMIKGLEL